MKSNLSAVWDFSKETFSRSADDRLWIWSAALAFYTLFSLSPILLIIITIAGFVFGEETARQQVFSEVEGLVGPEAAGLLDQVLAHTAAEGAGTTGIVSTLVSIAVIFYAASKFLIQLQDGLTIIWTRGNHDIMGVRQVVRNKLLTFALIFVIGFLLMMMIIGSAVIVSLSDFFAQELEIGYWLPRTVDFLVSWLFVTLFFGAIYKILTNAVTRWKDLWLGSVVASLLFNLGKLFISKYFGDTSIANAYGAAASLIVLLVGINYSTFVLLLGAEINYTYSKW